MFETHQLNCKRKKKEKEKKRKKPSWAQKLEYIICIKLPGLQKRIIKWSSQQRCEDKQRKHIETLTIIINN